MNKVLVTGATGFIGKQLVNYLHKEHIPIRVLVRDNQQANQFPQDVEVFVGDLTQAQTLKNLCVGITTIFHLAGFAHAFHETAREFAMKHHAINFLGTQQLFREAMQENVRCFIYVSSVKAVADSRCCVDENYAAMPTDAYGLAKRNAESFLLEQSKLTKMHISILRPALVYGPGLKGNLASMLRAIDKGYFLPIPETGNRRSLISLEDLCRAALLAASRPEAKGKVYYVTDGVAYSTRHIYQAMSDALGKRVPRWCVPLLIFKWLAAIGDVVRIIGLKLPFNSETITKLFGSAEYDSTLICRELAFKPHQDLQKALPAIVAAYRGE